MRDPPYSLISGRMFGKAKAKMYNFLENQFSKSNFAELKNNISKILKARAQPWHDFLGPAARAITKQSLPNGLEFRVVK